MVIILLIIIWLVVQQPSWKIWVRQWEGWHPIYEMDNEKCLKPATRMSFEPLWSDLRSLWSPFPCHIGFDGEDWELSQNKYWDIMGNHSVYTGTIWFIVTEGNSWPETMFFPRRCISVSCELSHHPILGNWHPTWQSTPCSAFVSYSRTISA